MERGMAREVATDFLHPLRRTNALWRFNVMRSANKLEYKLFTDAWDCAEMQRRPNPNGIQQENKAQSL
eukprot:5504190-Amphidinium_carterae.1